MLRQCFFFKFILAPFLKMCRIYLLNYTFHNQKLAAYIDRIWFELIVGRLTLSDHRHMTLLTARLHIFSFFSFA